MELNIKGNLNSTCEILGLLYRSKNYDKLTSGLIEGLNESGINGEAFFKKNLKLFDKYIKEFSKNMVYNDESDFFIYEEEEDAILFFIIIFIVTYIKDNNKDFDNMLDNDVRKLIIDFYIEMSEENIDDENLNSLEDILNFTERQDMSDKNKWKFMKLLNYPKKYINEIIKLVDANKNAYEIAYKKVEKDVIRLIDKTKKYILSGECEIINNIHNSDGEFEIVPTLAFAASICESKNILFVGVLNENIFKEQLKAIGNKGDLVLKLKALGDNSKLETISLLKMGPKYTLEIAESLNLTSATVSYHMSTLLEIGLVSVEKKQGKVYYNLNNENIEKFINDLSNVLL